MKEAEKKSMEMDLSMDWLLAPVTKEDFFANYYERKYLHIPRADHSYHSSLLSIEAVDELLYSQVVRFPSVRMTNSKEEVPPEKYVMGDRILPAQVIKYFSEGSTLILSGLHDHIASLGRLCSFLTRTMGHKFQTNIYITPKGSQGFNVHYDTHDVFVLQVKGRKKWRLYAENPIELPSKLQEFEKGKYTHGPLVEELILEEGDLLYIPRGIMHDADTLDEMSMHITTGMLGFTWTDLLIEGILDLSKKDPELRKYIPCELMTASKETPAFRKDFDAVLGQLMKGLDLEQIVSRMRKELVKTQKPNISGVLQTALALEDITASTSFTARKDVMISVSTSEKNVTLEWSGKKVEFPMFTLPAIEFLTGKDAGTSFTAADLPECMDEAGMLAMLKRLTKEGYLSINSIN